MAKTRKPEEEPTLFKLEDSRRSTLSLYERAGIGPTTDDAYSTVEKAKDGEPTKDVGTVSKGTQQIVEDPFRLDYDAYGVIRPPVNMLELASLWEKNSILGQCIEAMCINCEAFGHDYVPRFDPRKVTPEVRKRMLVEHSILTNFFEYASVNEPHLSFTDLRVRKRTDQESTGGAWWEVVRNTDGELMGFNHLPAYTCRFGKLTTEEVKAPQKMAFYTPDGTVEWRTRTVWRNFRLVLQRRGIRLAWFKTLGDPRIINRHNGYESDESLPVKDRANEVVFFPNVWSPRTPYPFPRFAGCLFPIYGSRSAEEINYTTFENNMIPSLAILVSNGMLTKGSIDRYQEFTEANIVKSKNYSTFLLLESEPVTEAVANPGTMRLSIEPLTHSQHKDELFQDYDKDNRKKVRGTFRMPPMFVGEVEGFNKSTAVVARKLADEQIFGPEREKFDTFMTRVIFPELGVLYWKFRSNTTDMTDNEDIIKVLAVAEKTGGSNPRIARKCLSRVMNEDLGPIEGIDPEVPWSMQLAEVMQAGGVPENRLSVPGENAANRVQGQPSAAATGLDRSTKADRMRRRRVELERMYQKLHGEFMADVFGGDEEDETER